MSNKSSAVAAMAGIRCENVRGRLDRGEYFSEIIGLSSTTVT